MNIQIDGAHRLVTPLDFTDPERAVALLVAPEPAPASVQDASDWGREYNAKQQAREDRAALAAMDVVEELSGAQSDDWEFNYLMEFFGMHIAEVVRARVASEWQETPLEASVLDRVADHAEYIAQWRDERETQHTFAALEELGVVAEL